MKPEIPCQSSTKDQNATKFSKNVEFDKFYTKGSVALACLQLLQLDKFDLILEPAAGNGSFLKHINHSNKVGLDIRPEHSSIIEQDFFKYKIDKKFKNVLVVGNPPFGINNDLSINFIKHASSFQNVSTIAFVLPDVFNKYSKQKKVPHEFRLLCKHKLPVNSFDINGNEFNLPCTFFVYDKSPGPDLRTKPDKKNPETVDFTFGSKFDYDFFAFGASPRKIVDSPTQSNRG